MPRANRCFLPDYVWHVTHRCHKKEFLFKFARDRQRYIYWLHQARKRFPVKVLNYMVTSNHVHLLLKNDADANAIPSFMQLVSSRSAQEYNLRKKRKGAFWEDRYHATAVETGEHLIQCLLYIDLNMVRAGVVSRPEEWPHCGYQELQLLRRRNTVIDRNELASLIDVPVDMVEQFHRQWIDDTLRNDQHVRQAKWSSSIAVGSASYVENVQQQLCVHGKSRQISVVDGHFVLREPESDYGADFDA
jgi:putative transposase